MIYGKEITAILISYVLGWICTGYYLTRVLTGKDIRLCGSGSTGARNVGRTLGRWGFVVTLAGDFIKGSAAILIAFALQVEPWAIAASLLAVAAGHIWPVQLAFRGGKGMAVTFGALLVFDYWLVVGLGLVFALVLLVIRKSAVSGLLSIATLPVLAVLRGHSTLNIVGIAILTLVIGFAHRANIRQFIRGRNTRGKSMLYAENVEK